MSLQIKENTNKYRKTKGQKALSKVIDNFNLNPESDESLYDVLNDKEKEDLQYEINMLMGRSKKS